MNSASQSGGSRWVRSGDGRWRRGRDGLGRAWRGEMKGYLVTGREHTGLKDYWPAHYSNVC